MRHSTTLWLLLVLVGAAWAGTATVLAGHGPADEVRVDGTVTGPDGAPADDAVVLVGDDGTLTEFSPAELRTLAAEDPPNLTVVEVDGDGRFEATVAWERADAAVAVSDAGTSDLLWIRGENATLDVQLHERRPQTVYAHLGAVSHGERRDELLVSMVNNDDATIENLTFDVVSVPEGWSVAGAETNGTYHADSRTVTWASVAPGEEVDTTVVLTVPGDAPPGEYTVELRAGSDTHSVDVESETVEVLPEDTPGPTTTPPPAGEGTTPTPGSGGTITSSATGASGPGFGLVAAVGVLAALAVLFVRT